MNPRFETMVEFLGRLPNEEQAKIRAGSKVISSEIKQARAKLRAKKPAKLAVTHHA